MDYGVRSRAAGLLGVAESAADQQEGGDELMGMVEPGPGHFVPKEASTRSRGQ